MSATTERASVGADRLREILDAILQQTQVAGPRTSHITIPLAIGDDIARLLAAQARPADAPDLAKKYQALVEFYDAHVGTPCEQVRHRQQVQELHRRAQKAEGKLARSERGLYLRIAQDARNMRFAAEATIAKLREENDRLIRLAQAYLAAADTYAKVCAAWHGFDPTLELFQASDAATSARSALIAALHDPSPSPAPRDVRREAETAQLEQDLALELLTRFRDPENFIAPHFDDVEQVTILTALERMAGPRALAGSEP